MVSQPIREIGIGAVSIRPAPSQGADDGLSLELVLDGARPVDDLRGVPTRARAAVGHGHTRPCRCWKVGKVERNSWGGKESHV